MLRGQSLLLSPAPSHQELHQVVAPWGCEGGCRRFCHFEGGPLQQPARRRACVPSGRTPCSRCLMLQRGSSTTGGSMTTSRLFFVMFSTGCQSHSASSTSSVHSSFNHYTELLPSICEIAALQLIPPRPGYDCDCLISRSTCAEDEDALRRLCVLGYRSSMLEQSPACHSFC